jgi:hypothetical protein
MVRLVEENKTNKDEISWGCQFPITPQEVNQNYLDVEIWPDVQNNRNNYELCPVKYLSERIGKYKYRIGISCYCKEGWRYYCYGDFEFETTTETAKQYQSELLTLAELRNQRADDAKQQAQHEKELQDSLKIDKNEIPAFFYNQSTFTDPELSIANIKKSLMNNKKWITEIIHLGIGEGEANWTIEYDKSMIPAQPIRKTTARGIYLILKSNDGKCFYGTCEMNKKYLNDEKKYGAMRPYLYKLERIPCYKVKTKGK